MRQIVISKLISDKVATGEEPLEGHRYFDMGNEDVIHDEELAAAVKDYFNTSRPDLEVFEFKGNLAFTSEGIYGTYYLDELERI